MSFESSQVDYAILEGNFWCLSVVCANTWNSDLVGYADSNHGGNLLKIR